MDSDAILADLKKVMDYMALIDGGIYPGSGRRRAARREQASRGPAR